MTRGAEPPRRRTRRSDGRSRYDDLLDAATQLFARLGYERTTVRLIADEMGIESGSLYSHISSKEQVLRDIVGRTANAFFDRAEAALAAAESESAEARLRALCRAHMRVVHEREDAVRVYYDEWRKLQGEYHDEIVALRDRYEGMFAGVVRDGIKSGEFTRQEVRWVVLAVLSALNWTPQWYAPGGRLGPDAVADRLVGVVLTGLRASG